jgi:AcrR family transcriptional regulator
VTTSLWSEGLHDTASRILDAASDLFAAQGYHATTIKEITERCGITQAALYLYFPSKDKLLAELIKVGHAELTRRLDEATARSAVRDPRSRLRALVGSLVEYSTECTIVARVADREWRALTEPQLSAAAELRRDVRRRFESAVRACLDQNLFALSPETTGKVGEHQAQLIATAIIDMCLGVVSWYEKSITVPTDALVASYQDLVLAMAGTKPRASRAAKR